MSNDESHRPEPEAGIGSESDVQISRSHSKLKRGAPVRCTGWFDIFILCSHSVSIIMRVSHVFRERCGHKRMPELYLPQIQNAHRFGTEDAEESKRRCRWRTPGRCAVSRVICGRSESVGGNHSNARGRIHCGVLVCRTIKVSHRCRKRTSAGASDSRINRDIQTATPGTCWLNRLVRRPVLRDCVSPNSCLHARLVR